MIKVYDARQDQDAILEKLAARNREIDESVRETVRGMIKAVREEGDVALLRYSKQFDWPLMTGRDIVVSEDEIAAAYGEIQPKTLNALRAAAVNIRAYHEKQLREGYMMGERGKRTGQLIRPLNRVGVYVPGGPRRLPFQRADEYPAG